MDSTKRSIAKALCWESLGIITLLIIGFFTVSSIKEVGILTGLFYLVRIIMYVGHERAWSRSRWGKIKRIKNIKGKNGKADNKCD